MATITTATVAAADTAQLPEPPDECRLVAADERPQADRLLYLIFVTIAFMLGGFFAAGIRIELTTPAGDLFRPTLTTSCSPCTASTWCSSC
jgi:hypothetical protein